MTPREELEKMSREGLIEYIEDCRAIIKCDKLNDDGTVTELPLEDCIAIVVRNWRAEAELGVRLRTRLIEIGDPQASME